MPPETVPGRFIIITVLYCTVPGVPRIFFSGPLNFVAPARKKMSPLIHVFRYPGLGAPAKEALLRKLQLKVPGLENIETEFCFNIDAGPGDRLAEAELEV